MSDIVGQQILDDTCVEVTVTSRKERYEKKGHRVHLRTTFVPESAIVCIDGEWRSSPELVFLELANFLNIHQLIALGMSLCSYPPWNPDAALTTKEKIQDLLEKAVWHRGRRKALRAIKYVKNASNSILESFVSMVLSLPHLLGGFGLKDIILNYEISLNEEASKMLGQDSCNVDFFIKDLNIAIEYQSNMYHSKPEEKERDKKRIAALESQGIMVIELDTRTFYSYKMFKCFIKDLFRIIGKRLQIRTKQFYNMHFKLRSLFPRKATT